MNVRKFDAAVLGAGAAGLAAAAELGRRGYSVAVLEREEQAGGILNQCIHNGFGLHYFHEELTGPEYAERVLARAGEQRSVELCAGTTAMRIEETEGGRAVYGFSRSNGITRFDVRALVLSMGCRERNRGNIIMPGSRPAGVFTAGLAQRLVNIEGYVPGERIVIVGSGDIGLIMARRMSWVGAKVLGVVEIQPYPSGLTRNIVQCLNDFGIPLYLSHVVTEIRGKDRVESVVVTPLQDGKPAADQSFEIKCDTLLLSVGLIPDNELSKRAGVELNHETGGASVDGRLMTSAEGIFACGNVLHVHDLVDYATEEAERCGNFAADYLEDGVQPEQAIVQTGANVRYVVPNRLLLDRENTFYLRSLVVKNKARLTLRAGDKEVMSKTLLHVQPSEMIRVTFRPDQADRVALRVGLEVSIQ